jgi:hypothetical protein
LPLVHPAPRASDADDRYRQLDEASIRDTIERLHARISERFPQAGLGRLANELREIAGETAQTIAFLQRPHWPLRIGVGLLIASMLAIVVAGVMTVRVPARVDGWAELIQVVESAINDVVFMGIAIFFLLSVEGRIKRRRALAALHELRSVVHIVDMHQLTKDPERFMSSESDTRSSPVRGLSPGELGRYLDYCSELLSLSSKVAALFAQQLDDPVVLAAVNEIETLAGGLSNKIWQKITLIERLPTRQAVPLAPPAP